MFLMNLKLEAHLVTVEVAIVLKITLLLCKLITNLLCNYKITLHAIVYLTNSKSNHINFQIQNKYVTVHTAFETQFSYIDISMYVSNDKRKCDIQRGSKMQRLQPQGHIHMVLDNNHCEKKDPYIYTHICVKIHAHTYTMGWVAI